MSTTDQPMMKSSTLRRATALTALAMFTQTACYNTYFIEKDELRKLEASVDASEVVTVYGDCASTAAAPAEARRGQLDGTMWAQADSADTAAPATDATATSDEPVNPRPECTPVNISTANTVKVLTADGDELRVTPFNFIMSQTQLVSPDYDLLLPLSQVEGAEVREFSTWKTVATAAGATLVTVGAFVAISILAPADGGFANQ
jgi:hypothetical protein